MGPRERGGGGAASQGTAQAPGGVAQAGAESGQATCELHTPVHH